MSTAADLSPIIAKLEAVGHFGGIKAAQSALLTTLREIIPAGIAAGHAPDGSAWAPLVSHAGSPLHAFADLTKVTPLGANVVTATVDHKWAWVHQIGMKIYPKNGPFLVFKINGRTVRARSVTLPRREIFPSDGKLPGPWLNPAADAMRAAVNAMLA